MAWLVGYGPSTISSWDQGAFTNDPPLVELSPCSKGGQGEGEVAVIAHQQICQPMVRVFRSGQSIRCTLWRSVSAFRDSCHRVCATAFIMSGIYRHFQREASQDPAISRPVTASRGIKTVCVARHQHRSRRLTCHVCIQRRHIPNPEKSNRTIKSQILQAG